MTWATTWQRLEGALLLAAALAIWLPHVGAFPWWAALLLFFAPDLSFAGYALGPRIGAIVYNTVHVYAFGAVFLALGLVMPSETLTVLGALWLAHAGFDRALGYGLKLPEGFEHTHLGRIGRSRKA